MGSVAAATGALYQPRSQGFSLISGRVSPGIEVGLVHAFGSTS